MVQRLEHHRIEDAAERWLCSVELPVDVGVRRIERPRAVAPPPLLEPAEGGPEPRIASIPETGQDPEADEEVVVVVVRVMDPVPRGVRLPSFFHQVMLQVE